MLALHGKARPRDLSSASCDLFERANARARAQAVRRSPYLMSSHPGSTLDDADEPWPRPCATWATCPSRCSDFYPDPLDALDRHVLLRASTRARWSPSTSPQRRTMSAPCSARSSSTATPRTTKLVRKALRQGRPRRPHRLRSEVPDPTRRPLEGAGRREQAERGAARWGAAERRQAGPRPEEGRRQPGRWQPERRAARRRQAGRRQQARRSVERRGTRRGLRAEVARRARWTLAGARPAPTRAGTPRAARRTESRGRFETVGLFRAVGVRASSIRPRKGAVSPQRRHRVRTGARTVL